MKIIFFIMSLTVFGNAYAERMKAICYWEVKTFDATIAFNMSKVFTVDLNPDDTKALATKLEILYKDYSMYYQLGKRKYERELGNIMSMGNTPNCLIYKDTMGNSQAHLIIENLATKIEATIKKKAQRYDWPKCPGVIDLNSSYNYVGMNLKTRCY